MEIAFLIRILGSVVADSSPLVIASMGETINERAGVINLSLDGSIMLSAMSGFAVAYLTGNVVLGFFAAMMVGALIALLIAFASITLHQDQVAVGFVLTLLGAELANFLGEPFVRRPGPRVPYMPIPLLSDIPVIGEIFFRHDILVYASIVLIVVVWFWLFKTQAGLRLRGVGERPEAAFARGVNVNRLRYLYTAIGGALVGIAGAAYSLSVKLGWSEGHTLGNGWIALAIVIFGGWHPLRVAFGAYLFGALISLGGILQRSIPGVPTQVFQAAPFALMILVLLFVSGGALERLLSFFPPRMRRVVEEALRVAPPAALGRPFVTE
jgi:simple sugar transport system permease protein